MNELSTLEELERRDIEDTAFVFGVMFVLCVVMAVVVRWGL